MKVYGMYIIYNNSLQNVYCLPELLGNNVTSLGEKYIANDCVQIATMIFHLILRSLPL